MLGRLVSDYGMAAVLLGLCGVFSAVTYSEQQPSGAAAGTRLARQLVRQSSPRARVLVVASQGADADAFTGALAQGLADSELVVVEVVVGQPSDARRSLLRIGQAGEGLDVIACDRRSGSWMVYDEVRSLFPTLAHIRVVAPQSQWWPTFLKADNLLNIANQIAVIAIVAVGMTLVIVTGGIDLSVGSLIALSAVLVTLLIRDHAGGMSATATGMVLCSLAAIGVCGALGAFSGSMITFFRIPPFIGTLAMMLVARGLAYLLTKGESVYQVPASFVWLGGGSEILDIPNAAVLMVILYAVAQLLMSRTTLGRYLYAVGGNAEAARLSGVPVRAVLLFAYTASGALAGLGGVVTASQLKSGAPTYGQMYELYVIAAVVVGGTSLSGGEGRVLGTLIGAFIIAVIRNGMNLIGMEPYTQEVVFGLVILAAVLLDRLKQWGWRPGR